ncbi:hypothetical protein ACWHAM_23565 [Paenibacillus terrae]
MKIRTAHHEDIPALAYLMEELGYPTSVEDMKLRYMKEMKLMRVSLFL